MWQVLINRIHRQSQALGPNILLKQVKKEVQESQVGITT